MTQGEKLFAIFIATIATIGCIAVAITDRSVGLALIAIAFCSVSAAFIAMVLTKENL